MAKLAGAVEYTTASLQKAKTTSERFLNITSCLGDLGNVEYPFIAITPMSTVTKQPIGRTYHVSTSYGPTYGLPSRLGL